MQLILRGVKLPQHGVGVNRRIAAPASAMITCEKALWLKVSERRRGHFRRPASLRRSPIPALRGRAQDRFGARHHIDSRTAPAAGTHRPIIAWG